MLVRCAFSVGETVVMDVIGLLQPPPVCVHHGASGTWHACGKLLNVNQASVWYDVKRQSGLVLG